MQYTYFIWYYCWTMKISSRTDNSSSIACNLICLRQSIVISLKWSENPSFQQQRLTWVEKVNFNGSSFSSLPPYTQTYPRNPCPVHLPGRLRISTLHGLRVSDKFGLTFAYECAAEHRGSAGFRTANVMNFWKIVRTWPVVWGTP